MTELTFTVSETVSRQYGKIMEIDYTYDEVKEEQLEENMQIKQEKRARNYKATIKRSEYERLAGKVSYQRNVLPFDTFVNVLRPFMMSTYTSGELQEAFRLLDRNYSNTIDLDELSAFVPVIHPNMTKDTLLNHIIKVSHNGDEQINFDEFRQMILRGIARDIVCGEF